MKNKIILSAIFLMIPTLNLNAFASTPPLALIFHTKVKSISNSSVKVEVIKPEKSQSDWDKIAATYKGCILDGEIEMLNGRANLKFQTLQCKNRSASQIKGLAISTDDMKIGLSDNPKVGTSVDVLVVDTYQK
jgi:hypothetical protein